jgi:hypothetical protein
MGLLEKYGCKVPAGGMAKTPEEAYNVAQKLGTEFFMNGFSVIFGIQLVRGTLITECIRVLVGMPSILQHRH